MDADRNERKTFLILKQLILNKYIYFFKSKKRKQKPDQDENTKVKNRLI